MKKSRWYGNVSITVVIATAIGILVLFAVSIVFGVGVWLAKKNTFDLLSSKANQALTADVNQVEVYLQPAEDQVRFIVDLITRGEIDPNDRSIFGTLLLGTLAAAPQIEAVVFVDRNLVSFGVSRITSSGHAGPTFIDNPDYANINESMQAVSQGPLWLPPIWHDAFQKTYVARAHPVILEGELVGAVIAEVAVEELSRFISSNGLETTGSRFILYGRNHVLAHRYLMEGYPNRSAEFPLPRLEQFEDPVIASIWRTEALEDTENHLLEGTDVHLVEVERQEFVFVFKALMEFGPEPMVVGAYFPGSDIPKEIMRMIIALIAGLITLVISLIAAIYLGKRIARPIVRFSSSVSSIRNLDVSKVEELPSSVFRELNDQSVAFNSMLSALRWFELYVPKKIVDQLIRHGDIQSFQSDARQVTVMFTDVVGFSTASEGMQAEEVAAFVNHHFSIVVQCIENEEGTVDKFMGDAVMAFWQNSERLGHGAERACRAALAISAAIREDNSHRQAQGDPPVGIRIGIHTGLATIGNIGAPGRVNYTIIGDTVNIGKRLEQLGKEVYPCDNDVSILISGETAEKLTSVFTPISAGRHKLQGRVTEIAVYKLEE